MRFLEKLYTLPYFNILTSLPSGKLQLSQQSFKRKFAHSFIAFISITIIISTPFSKLLPLNLLLGMQANQAFADSSPTIAEFPVLTSNSAPDAITSGPDGNLWFIEPFFNANKIGRITPSGAVTEYSILTSNSDPRGITSGPDGNLWFTEEIPNKIGRITPSGAITEFKITSKNPNPSPCGCLGADSSDPRGITAGPDGNVWFTEVMTNKIGRITPSGAITEFKIPTASSHPSEITLGSDGNLWFTESDAGKIGRITPSGAITEFQTSASNSYPYAITLGPDGNVWFIDGDLGGSIGRITPSGVITEFQIPISYSSPQGITSGPDGNVWFTQASAPNEIGRITPSGVITEFPVQTNIGLADITSGSDGNLWFTDRSQSKIGRFSLPNPCPLECLLASNAAYGLDTGNFGEPSGMTEVDRSANVYDGFEAVALKDSSGNIIIANEGANIASPFGRATPYQNWSAVADGEILAGLHPKALDDAVNFAIKIKNAKSTYGGNGKIYVTGHDLGGVEAEAQAQVLPADIAGGATFGASGLPKNATAGGPSTLVNYIDYGDPFGSWSSDTYSMLNIFAPDDMFHYGSLQPTGNPSNNYLIAAAVATKKVADFLPNELTDLVDENLPVGKKYVSVSKGVASTVKMYNLFGKYASPAEYSFLAAGTYYYHPLIQYASDLGISLTPKETVAPPTPVADYIKQYDPTASAVDLKNADKTTISSSGDLTSPDMDISFDANTDKITNEEVVDHNGSSDVTFDPTEGVSSVKTNEFNGGSYEIFNDDNNTHTWSSYTDFYSRKNETGKLIEAIYNWHAGGSQVQLFSGLPKGRTEEIENYSDPDGTGTLINTSFK